FNQKKMTLSPTYESISGNFYYTQAQPLAFGARDAVPQVNQWFDQHTSHLFPSIIDHSDLTESMYLLNAFCFKGSWKNPFKSSSHHSFYLTPTVPKAVKFMSTIAVFPIFSDTVFTMVELPCGEKNAYSLYILLPENEARGVKGLLASLTPRNLDEALNRLTPQNINLFLPGWESNFSIDDLRPLLSRLGMSLAFSIGGEADFSNMYSTGAKKATLSQARHLTCIRVNENGIETAPAASELPAPLADIYSRRLPRTVTFDHPFLYLLMDKQHDLILQMGVVDDPKLGAVKPTAPAPPKRPVIRLPRRRK
ncbi:MAG TPA: serpin family protein, partial [Puia sp.]